MTTTPHGRSRGKKRRPRITRDPHIVGMAAGWLVATAVLALSLYRQSQGIETAPMQVALWAGLAFVVSYAASGLFLVFVHRVAERELRAAAEAKRMQATDTPAQAAPAAQPAADTGEQE